ncbi:MAG: TetR family transcriptional regulator, partial [Stackebrandtia sp.]
RERTRVEECLAQLVRRAKEAGQLRDDFDYTDITLIMLANSGVITDSPRASLAASKRLVGYLLQSFHSGHTAPLPPPASLGLGEVHRR